MNAVWRGLRVAIVAVVAGCGGGVDSSPTTQPPTQSSLPGTMVTAAGGTVESADRQAQLVIPAGALSADSAISVDAIELTATPPSGGAPTRVQLGPFTLLKSYQFGPHGLAFAQPARLTLQFDPAALPAGSAPEQLRVVKLREDGLIELMHRHQLDTQGRTVSVDITGFSKYAIVVPPPRDPSPCSIIDETLNDDLRVDSVATDSVTLSWLALGVGPSCSASNPVQAYEVEYALDPISGPAAGQSRAPLDSDYASVWQVAARSGRTSKTVNLPPSPTGTTYRFRILAHSLYNNIVWRPVGSVLGTTRPSGPASAPAAPAYFVASWDDPYTPDFEWLGTAASRFVRVRLNWSLVPDARDYVLLRREEGELLYSQMTTVAGGVVAYDDNVAADKRYHYRVFAENDFGKSGFVETEVLPLGRPVLTIPAFRLCVDSNQIPLDNGGRCDWPPTPFKLATGTPSVVRFEASMVPVIANPAPGVNVPPCDIRFSLFNLPPGVLPAAAGGFAPEPVRHDGSAGSVEYAVEMRLDVAATAELGRHAVTLYATGCEGTIARQPLVLDIRPPNTAEVVMQVSGLGTVIIDPAGLNIACSATCPVYVPLGGSLPLDTGNVPVTWGGDCSFLGNQTSGSVPVDGDKLCTADFSAGNGSGRIAAGNLWSLARDSANTAYSWGSDNGEALGNGTCTPVPPAVSCPVNAPGRVSLPADAARLGGLYGGAGHGIVVRSSGEVWGWGINSFGQLSNGGNSTQAVPVPMQLTAGTNISGAIAAAAGVGHSLVLLNNGTVLASGLNSSGELGDGTNANRPFAVPVLGLNCTVTAIAAGSHSSYALCDDGTVRAWGANDRGRLGDGGTMPSPVPVNVLLPVNANVKVTAIAAGDAFALALLSNGEVWSWGANDKGQLGDGSAVAANASRPAPAKTSVTGATGIACGVSHAFAIVANGGVVAWGDNTAGKLGVGDNALRNVPIPIAGLSSVVALAGGNNHSLALHANGKVMSWGSNASGELGLGSAALVFMSPQEVPGLNLN